ncbi:sugar phosphate nucleotidyltransferase [Desulfobacterota bacterium M19]
MILAAGQGTRLRPYSIYRPKPLFPVLGRPLILHTVDLLRRAGFQRIIVNARYLARQIIDLLDSEADIIIQEEVIELGTGGALRLAMADFGSEPVLVTNGDIYHHIDYGTVYDAHVASGRDLTMLMHDYPRFNSVLVDNGELKFLRAEPHPPGGTLLAYTGIQVLNPAILADIKPAVFVDIIDYYQQYIENGGFIRAALTNNFWHDMGTAADYLALHARLLPVWNPPGGGWRRMNKAGFYVAAGVKLGRQVSLRDWGIIGSGAVVGDNACLQRVVVWDGALIPAGAVLTDQIVGVS